MAELGRAAGGGAERRGRLGGARRSGAARLAARQVARRAWRQAARRGWGGEGRRAARLRRLRPGRRRRGPVLGRTGLGGGTAVVPCGGERFAAAGKRTRPDGFGRVRAVRGRNLGFEEEGIRDISRGAYL